MIVLSREMLGLSRRYTDWPGFSSIIIPLVSEAATTGHPAGTLPGEDLPAASRPEPRAEDRPPPSEATPPQPMYERTAPPDAREPKPPEALPAPLAPDLEQETEKEEPAGKPLREPERVEQAGEREPESKVAEDEIESMQEEPPFSPEPTEADGQALSREQRTQPRNRYLLYTGGPLLLFLLLFALVLLVRYLKKRAGGRHTGAPAYFAVRREGKTGTVRQSPAGMKKPVVMRVIYRGLLLNRKHLGDLQENKRRSVGGRGAYYTVPYLNLPRRTAEVENRGNVAVFIPLKTEFFPELSAPVYDFFDKPIMVRGSDGKEVILVFSRYVSPLEEINRLMRSVRPTGESHSVEARRPGSANIDGS